MEQTRGSQGFSGTPRAVCGNAALGLPMCKRGRDGKCYWRGICSSQMRLDDPEKRTENAEIMYKSETKRALAHARSESDQHPELEQVDYEEALRILRQGGASDD